MRAYLVHLDDTRLQLSLSERRLGDESHLGR